MASRVDNDKELERLVESTRRRANVLSSAAQEYAHSGDVERLDRTLTLLKDTIRNPKLPRLLVNEVAGQIKTMQLHGYSHFIDLALKHARTAAQRHDDRRKNELIKAARDHLPKAMALGAPDEFKVNALRLIDIILMTGTPVVEPDRGTVAKPVDRKTPLPNRAKGAVVTHEDMARLRSDTGDGNSAVSRLKNRR